MHIWQPEPGETLLARTPVTFATGAAMRVKGMRWFRDTGRRDIQGELPGWPEGPVHTPRSTGTAGTLNVVKGGLIAMGVAIMGILSSQGGSVGGGSSDQGSDEPDDRADEVEDFPVMWAAPGAVARTLPWQLDPGRTNAKCYTTHAVITDRRLIVLGLPVHKDRFLVDDEVLWEVPRSAVAAVEPRDFKDGTDVKTTFTDGSWCRLRPRRRPLFIRYLHSPLQLVSLESLTPAQQHTVRVFAEAQPPDSSPPHIVRNSCGCYRIAVVAPSTIDALFGAANLSTVMDAEGRELDLSQYHPQDFSS
ncbi:hypothetical protein [Streptomyces lycii]|uniref:Uncharacterized protein n=1 Tax=Streptomyces lycii TaxID=2654337 RepID=A0ABQ7F8H2_9ACTN|nr:hypothetical protein [Streptomyces lycii]KAF4405011.1 hypothetical protein GCU69_32500 [Streptomyces lycii]